LDTKSVFPKASSSTFKTLAIIILRRTVSCDQHYLLLLLLLVLLLAKSQYKFKNLDRKFCKGNHFPSPSLDTSIACVCVCVCVREREREREKRREFENLADRMEDVLAQFRKILSNSSDQNTPSPLPQAPKKGGKRNYKKKKKKGRRIYSAAEVQRMPITAPGRRTLLRKGRMAMVEGRSKCSAIALCSQVTHVEKNKKNR
jgi:hypothetical protein